MRVKALVLFLVLLVVSLAPDAFAQFGTMTLTNRSGGALSKYAVVVVDTANDSSFTTTTTERDDSVVGVVWAASIANNAAGMVVLRGSVAEIEVTGAISRGDFLITSTTAGKAKSGGTSDAGGAFGLALEGGTNTNVGCVLVSPGVFGATSEYTVGTLHVQVLLDVNEEATFDFDANDEEITITTTANDYAADSAIVTIYDNVAGGQTNAAYLLRLRHKADGDVHDHYLIMEDNDGDDMFKVDSGGVTTIAGLMTGLVGFKTPDDQDDLHGTDSDIRVRYDEATDDRMEWHDGTNTLMWLTPAGYFGLQNDTDSTTAYQWLDADGGTPIVNIDTVNERLGILIANPGVTFHVGGPGYFDGGVTTAGAAGNFLMISRDGTGSSFQWYNPTGDDVRLYVASDLVIFDDSGNLDITGAYEAGSGNVALTNADGTLILAAIEIAGAAAGTGLVSDGADWIPDVDVPLLDVAETISANWVNTANPWAVNEGGTGAATFTDHGILVGSGAGAVTALAAATNGQIPIGSTGADPVPNEIDGTANQVIVTNGAGTVTLSLPQDIGTGSSPTFVASLATAGAAAAAVAHRFGDTATEGWEIRVIDETVSGLNAITTDLTEDIPTGAVILGAQLNIEAALTGGGTTTKVGVGDGDVNPDLYGLSADLAKNTKIDLISDWAVLGGALSLEINACTDAGALGDTALTVGDVRVRIVYAVCNSLDDAA